MRLGVRATIGIFFPALLSRVLTVTLCPVIRAGKQCRGYLALPWLYPATVVRYVVGIISYLVGVA